jgi:hypothetical protein
MRWLKPLKPTLHRAFFPREAGQRYSILQRHLDSAVDAILDDLV